MARQKILIDAFGADFPDQIISGIADVLELDEQVELVVTGNADYIKKILKKRVFDRRRLELVDCKEVVTNDDAPVEAILTKKNSSLCVGLKLLRDREDIGCMISAGNTGAVIAGSVLILGRELSCDRPTLLTVLPNDKGGFTCLADCGANVDCKPHNLLKFGEYASDYSKKVLGVKNPKVALLSVGTEDKKGNALTKEAFKLLKESSLNFVGNVESGASLSGEVDVVVADGFSGNVLLKSIESTAKSVSKRTLALLEKYSQEEGDTKFVSKAFDEFTELLNLNLYGGAILLGTKKPIVKAHSYANAQTVINTVRQAQKICQSER